MSSRPIYSFVVPIYNEESVIPLLISRMDELLQSLDGPAEVLFVDDGSHDCSPIVLRAKAKSDPRYRYVRLSRNFGHQIAITTGLDRAQGDAVVVMDADLQDPPEIVHQLIAKWREGFQVVSAQRRSRSGESRFKRASASLFYRFLRSFACVDIPQDVGDFRLVDRAVLESFRSMRERERFVRGMFAWLGYRQTTVPFDRAARMAGETKYPLSKMIRLASDALISFSEAPLRAALWSGISVSLVALAYGCYVVGLWLTDANLVPGWSSTIVVTSLLCGVNLLMTGIMGLYVGRIYSEVKERPLYVIDQAMTLDGPVESFGEAHTAEFASASRAA
ncbi:MAG TPA: glycosyltransferase family 2 protein [Beijerinckiaceae bacterium]|nr:glycosyltransferase family 2 protein [Beijerinckiaceae bacterium]